MKRLSQYLLSGDEAISMSQFEEWAAVIGETAVEATRVIQPPDLDSEDVA